MEEKERGKEWDRYEEREEEVNGGENEEGTR